MPGKLWSGPDLIHLETRIMTIEKCVTKNFPECFLKEFICGFFWKKRTDTKITTTSDYTSQNAMIHVAFEERSWNLPWLFLDCLFQIWLFSVLTLGSWKVNEDRYNYSRHHHHCEFQSQISIFLQTTSQPHKIVKIASISKNINITTLVVCSMGS